MRFAVFAITPVPDTATARALFDLEGLDDADVARVLFHRRRQQTGTSEALRWDQRAIAGICLIQHSVDQVQIQTLTLAGHDEVQMLEAFFRAAVREGRLVSWDGERLALPLLHFRSLRHAVSFPAYWQTRRERADWHLDVRQWLAAAADDAPDLDETARRLGLPGMPGLDQQRVYEAWLGGRHADIAAYCELSALNVYLIALRLFSTTGQLSRHDAARVQLNLRETLLRREEPSVRSFLDAWDQA